MREEGIRLLRFGAVGASNTALTLTAFALLSRTGVGAGAASGLAFAVGAVNGYVLNRWWTFRAGGSVLRYAAVQALGALLSGSGVALVAADLDLRRLVAELLVLPFITLITYALCRRVVFTGARLAAPR
jgi:putative flippase GtrA